MKHNSFIPMRSLQIFAEGGASGDGGTAQGTGVTAPDAGVHKGVKSNPLADVKYGIQPQESAPAAGVQQTTEVKPDRNAEFEKLIKGDYKEQYDARVQDTVQKRLKGQKDTVDKFNALSPALGLLAHRYGVDPTDAQALAKAIENDNALYEAEAAKAGMDVEQYKKYEQMRRQNEQFRAQMEDQKRKDHAAQQYATWTQQAEQAKQIYPGLDLEAEVKNPQFMRLLNSGVDVGSAYLVIHKDEVIPAAMQHVAQTVEQKLAGKIAANGARPAENGMKAPGGAVVKSDVTQLSKLDRAEINRRVARGEKISFG